MIDEARVFLLSGRCPGCGSEVFLFKCDIEDPKHPNRVWRVRCGANHYARSANFAVKYMVRCDLETELCDSAGNAKHAWYLIVKLLK